MSKTTNPKDNGGRMNDLLKQPDMTVSEAAEVLGLSRQAVYALIERNKITVARRKTERNGVFVSTESVIQFMRKDQLRQVPAKPSR